MPGQALQVVQPILSLGNGELLSRLTALHLRTFVEALTSSIRSRSFHQHIDVSLQTFDLGWRPQAKHLSTADLGVGF